MNSDTRSLKLKWLGIDTYMESVIFMNKNCPLCRSEGFDIHARIAVQFNDRTILATLNTIDNGLLDSNEASLSSYAWNLLDAKEGEVIHLSHPHPLQSLSFVRSKVYGHALKTDEISHIIEDISKGHYSDIHIATFLTACAGGRLNKEEIIDLTKSMINSGQKLQWPREQIVDKHCVGGIPGNRTTLIIVPIITAFGLMMPKTSSRAITSPSGTADTMEIFAPVDLDLKKMRAVVEKENGCIIWGGSVALSPADDILIRVERVMDLDSEGQLIASVLSKKIAAGSNHILLDIPVGSTAKVRSFEMAHTLQSLFQVVGNALGITVHSIITDGSQPIGRGIGPSLEAQDVLLVLQNDPQAPQDLRNRALELAGNILEFSANIKPGEGKIIAERILNKGEAFEKFKAICCAQGDFREPPIADFHHTIESPHRGKIISINNRYLANLAKLAGAPHDKAAGVFLHAHLEMSVEEGQPLFTIYAENKGELNYALSMLNQVPQIIQVEPHT